MLDLFIGERDLWDNTGRTKQCVVNDSDWPRIRANTVRTHNRPIGIQPPTTLADGPATATATLGYQRDTEVLAEDATNIETGAKNARQLKALQEWIKGQM